MDLGTGGTEGTCPPLFKDSGKVPLLCNLVALLENFENVKMNKNYTFPVISEDLSFKISRGSMPPEPLNWFELSIPPD